MQQAMTLHLKNIWNQKLSFGENTIWWFSERKA